MFRKINALVLGVFLAFGVSISADATQVRYVWDNPVGFIKTSAYTSAPRGFVDFCNRYPEDCLSNGVTRSRVPLTLDRMRELNTTNADVNDSLFFNSDLANRDRWDYPTDGYGDCEDFVIEKRKRLIELGWPQDALLITIARRRHEELPELRTHAVLTVRTAQGDYILDNDIRPAVAWTKAARLYDYVMMQSERNPQLWALVDSHTRLP